MKFPAPALIIGWLTCCVASSEKGAVPSAANVASGAAEVTRLYTKSANVEQKLQKEVDEMVTQSAEKVKSLKGMLTTNSKAIAALTGLFKEVSALTAGISAYEVQLRKCKTELAEVKTQQEAGPQNEAFFNSVNDDPLAGPSFFQQKAETVLVHATNILSKIDKSPQGISLLQSRHRHHRRSVSQEENSDDSSSDSSTENALGTDAQTDAVAFGLNTISSDEEDMSSRVRNVGRSNVGGGLPGMDPLAYGMYDFTGSSGVKIFDHNSLDPQVQRKRELDQVNLANRMQYGRGDSDDDSPAQQDDGEDDDDDE